ncbi:MAG: hypothetical protein AAF335_03300 [Bacteroidota bacterium]
MSHPTPSYRNQTIRWVEVTPPLAIAHPLCYQLPVEAPADPLGYRVVVPLGKRVIVGLITAVCQGAPSTSVREIIAIPDEHPLFNKGQLDFLCWLSSYYLCPLGQVIRAAWAPLPMLQAINLQRLSTVDNVVVPTEGASLWEALQKCDLSMKEAMIYLPKDALANCVQTLAAQKALFCTYPLYEEESIFSFSDRYFDDKKKLLAEVVGHTFKTSAQKRFSQVYAALVDEKKSRWVSEASLLAGGISSRLLSRLVQAGQVVTQRRARTLPSCTTSDSVASLTVDEQVLMEVLMEAHKLKNGPVAFVPVANLSTEKCLYSAFAKHTIHRQVTRLLMVPNLESLQHWKAYLSPCLGDHLFVWSSEERASERQALVHRLHQGVPTFVLGMPSALLLPFKKIDDLMVTLSYSPDYKRPSAPSYHARDAAIMLAHYHKCDLFLTGYIPSLESYHNITKGKYYALPRLQKGSFLPPAVRVIPRKRRHPILTATAVTPLKEVFRQKKKVVFLHPWRGYTAGITCKKCPWEARCPTCPRTLVLHQGKEQLQCHSCQASSLLPEHCPACQSHQLHYRRTGSQHLAEELQLHFPNRLFARIDSDSTPSQGTYHRTLHAFRQGTYDGIIATQRLLRALPYLDTAVIAVVDPHSWTIASDYQGPIHQRYMFEDLFHHATAEEVILLSPHSQVATLAALRQNLPNYYDDYLQTCQTHGYPPYVRLLKICVRHPSPTIALEATQAIDKTLTSTHQLTTLGPVPNPPSHATLWVRTPSQKAKEKVTYTLKKITSQPKYKKVNVTFEVDAH